MTEQPTALDALRPTLDAIPEADVKHPTDTIDQALMNAGTVLAHVEEQDDLLKTLLRVGLKAAAFEDLKTAISALRAAQIQLDRARAPRRKPEEQKALEESGLSLRDDILAACRWNLRHNLSVQPTLDAISEGQSIGDLIADLNTLAQILEENHKSFSTDKSFDAKAQAKAARAAADTLLEAVADRRPTLSRADAMSLRNRAWTYFERTFQELRDAAQYAFRKHPDKLALFAPPAPESAPADAPRKRRARSAKPSADAAPEGGSEGNAEGSADADAPSDVAA
jgi:outer membrane lipopolysaccharide assembly protein LptE/RlpB